jgi:hypothetical protein
VEDFGGGAETTGGVFGVGYYNVNGMTFAQFREEAPYGAASRAAYDVTDK